MHLNIKQFSSLKKWQLYAFSPAPPNSDYDICLLTHQDASEIMHAVITSDNNIYDAFALHTWVHKQSHPKFVIPGLEITSVRGTFIILHFMSMYSSMLLLLIRDYSQTVLEYLRKVNEIRKPKVEQIDKCVQTDELSTESKDRYEIASKPHPQKKCRHRVCIPSAKSAFKPFSCQTINAH